MTAPTTPNPERQPADAGARVYVEVSGLTGSGKSAIMGEIEIALMALGLTVEHDASFQVEKNMTHADWQEALDLYRPTVVLSERNIPRTGAPQAQPDARAGEVEALREALEDAISLLWDHVPGIEPRIVRLEEALAASSPSQIKDK